MRRIRSLVNGLPPDSSLARRLATVPAPQPPPPAKKVDYAALRALGGEVISVPRGG